LYAQHLLLALLPQVIKDICMSNAMDIAGCISEMGDMQAGVEELRALLQEGNEALQVGD
jgi:hypothetical protein